MLLVHKLILKKMFIVVVAVALHYGVFRRKDFNATAQNIMFYDMGAGSAVVTIACKLGK